MLNTTPSKSNLFNVLFGTRFPIIAGGLMWLSNAEYVAAAANAGILGFITAASFPEYEALRNEIRKCRNLANGNLFGVNVSMLPKLVSGEKTKEVFQLIIDEGITIVETSGRNPEAYLPMLNAAGIKVIHKVPAVKYALKAQQIGVDAVTIVGAECGGHPGMDMIGSFVNAAMAMGASGVVIGTRFLVVKEIWAHDDYKQALIDACETDTALCMSSIRNTARELKNETTDKVQQIEKEQRDISIQDLLPYISGKIGYNAYVTGDTRRGMLAAGHALAFVNKQQPLAEIVDSLINQANQALVRTQMLTSI